MSSKTNIKRIVCDHLETLHDHSNGKRWDVADVFAMAGLPLASLAASLYWRVRLPDSLVNAGITAFSVFAGLLLSVLVLLYSVVQSDKPRPPGSPPLSSDEENRLRLRKQFLKQVHANVSFAILEAVSVIVLSLFLLACPASGWQAQCAVGLTAALIALTVNFLLTLLMVLKRIHVLIEKELTRDGAAGAHA